MWSLLFVFLIGSSFVQAATYRGGGHGSSHGGGGRYPSSSGSSHSGGYSGGSGGYHSSGHSYPTSHGLSGNNHVQHSYRSSNGMSGSGYPSHSANNHGQHSYPASNGMSGSGYSGNQYHGNPPVQHPPYGSTNQQYANQHPYSGSHQSQPTYTHHQQTTVHHHHYNYNPPQTIHYGSKPYPVYHGPPPTYVYEYRNSGSKYDTLLTGLALYNLGKMSSHHSHHGYNDYGYNNNNGYNSRRYGSSSNNYEYKSNPGEVCKLGIVKENGDAEETKIDCKIMSSFIMEADVEAGNNINKLATTSTSTTTTTATTQAPIAQHNTTLNDTVNSPNASTISKPANEDKPIQNNIDTHAEDALTAKGPLINVTPKMQCYVKHITKSLSSKKEIPCSLLKTYADSSLHERPV